MLFFLTFGELEFLTGFLLTEFLTLHHSRVAGKKAFGLKDRTVFGIYFANGPRQGKANRLGLAGNSTAVYIYLYIVGIFIFGQSKRLLYFVLKCSGWKVVVQIPLVYRNVSCTWGNIDTGNSRFSSSNFVNSLHYLNSFKLITVGFCASWLCSAPTYTLRFLKSSAPNLFLGSIPLTAFSTIRAGSLAKSSLAEVDRCPPG